VGHADDLGEDRSVEALERRCHEVLDAAWRGGVRWFDAARSYGRAEAFLSSWLQAHAVEPRQATVSSKWGYTYTAGWRADAEVHEVKDHSREALERQWPETAALLGRWLRLYQVHSATFESGVLDDGQVHRALAALPVPVGLTLSGPAQAGVLGRALELIVDGRPLFSAVQATWNVLETSVGPALGEAHDAGWTVIVKEALANGILTRRGRAPAELGERPDVVALAAALAQPWADVVLSGASTPAQLQQNLAARELAESVDLDALASLARAPDLYWSERSSLPWT
jgi:aryl-alcohol dehydrogenase-like predicted oxidoreductase